MHEMYEKEGKKNERQLLTVDLLAVFSGYFPSLVVIAILFFGHIHICVRFPKGLTSLIACSET